MVPWFNCNYSAVALPWQMGSCAVLHDIALTILMVLAKFKSRSIQLSVGGMKNKYGTGRYPGRLENFTYCFFLERGVGFRVLCLTLGMRFNLSLWCVGILLRGGRR